MTRTIAWWQVLRAVLVLGWVVWAALTWWVAPREVGLEQAQRDVATGRVVEYSLGSGWRTERSLLWPSRPVLEAGAEDRIFLWETPDGRQFYTETDAGLLQAATRLSGDSASLLPRLVTGLAVAGVVVALWALVSAPDPATGTKWFWWWILALVPFGLGLLWWLARERPWARGVAPRDRRRRWYAGVGWGILAGLAVSVIPLPG